jgi:hypothetical protein
LEQRAAEVGAVDDLKALLDQAEDLVGADRLGGVDVVDHLRRGTDDLALDAAVSEVAPVGLGQRGKENRS